LISNRTDCIPTVKGFPFGIRFSPAPPCRISTLFVSGMRHPRLRCSRPRPRAPGGNDTAPFPSPGRMTIAATSIGASDVDGRCPANQSRTRLSGSPPDLHLQLRAIWCSTAVPPLKPVSARNTVRKSKQTRADPPFHEAAAPVWKCKHSKNTGGCNRLQGSLKNPPDKVRQTPFPTPSPTHSWTAELSLILLM
jgi:hypothetical protein